LPRALGREVLRGRRFADRLPALVEDPRRAVDDEARRLGAGAHLRETEGERLVLDQRLAERAPLLGVLDRQLERLLRRADAARAERRAALGEAALGVVHALAFLADQRLGGDARILEHDLGDRRALVAGGVEHLPDR